MEEEAEKLKELQAETEKTMGMQSTSPTAAGIYLSLYARRQYFIQ